MAAAPAAATTMESTTAAPVKAAATAEVRPT